MVLFFAGDAVSRQNPPGDSYLSNPSQQNDGVRNEDEADPILNEQIVSMSKTGIGDELIISLISNFPSDFDASPRALMKLRDSGVSDSVIDAVKKREAQLKQSQKDFKVKVIEPNGQGRGPAIPAAQETGLPPKVLKWIRLARVLKILGVVTTAAKGTPLPIPFAMVTMSGMTP